jgi:Spy/CpxP family protein refolding chaperone
MNGSRGLLIGILAAFIVGCSAGLVGGILLTRVARAPWGHMGHGGPRPGGPGHAGGPGPMLDMMEQRLDLKPEQRQRVEKILEDSRHGYEQVRESTNVAIERELTPEQREQWKQMEERFLRERRRGFGRPPWRGDRP